MTQKRFDISALSSLESRDGSLTKGGRVVNGFGEVDGAGERWSNMRPALLTSYQAPFPGTGMGMFIVGTQLYGMQNGTSWEVSASTPYTLVATDLGGVYGYSISTSGGTFTYGSLSPAVWKGFTVSGLQANNGGGNVSWFGAVGSSVFQKIVLHTKTFTMAAAVFSTNDGQTLADFSQGVNISEGTWTGNFR